MKFHTFPNTDLTVSRLCFGCWGVISDTHWGDRNQSDSVQAMSAAIDAGINFFDTAPMYGNGGSEELLGAFLADNQLRHKVVVATKIRPGQMTAEKVIQECEESLQRLRTDYIDLYQTHWSTPGVSLDETWQAMQQLQQQGKVRQIGVCNAGTGDLADISASQKPLSNQLPYNLIWRMIEDQILPTCVRDDIGVLVYSPLMHGILADKFPTAADVPDGRARSRHFSSARSQTRHGEAGCEAETFATLEQIRTIAAQAGCTMAELSLAWIAHQTGIVSVIAGAANQQQLQANLNFVERTLSEDIIANLNRATAPLLDVLGSNPDMWDGTENSRYH